MFNETSKKEWQTFYHNVVWLRTHCGLSKTKMAALLGIGVGSLNKIEKGILPPRLTIWIFVEIYHHFGIRPDEQLTRRLGEDDTHESS